MKEQEIPYKIYLGENDKNVAFWAWYTGELKKVKPDVYTVAEVWDGDGINQLIAFLK